MVNTLFNCHVSFQSFYNQEVVLYNFQTDVSCLLEVVINSPLRVVSKVEVVIKVVIKVQWTTSIYVYIYMLVENQLFLKSLKNIYMLVGIFN